MWCVVVWLCSLDFFVGSCIVIILKNCVYWIVIDLVIWMVGYVFVFFYFNFIVELVC